MFPYQHWYTWTIFVIKKKTTENVIEDLIKRERKRKKVPKKDLWEKSSEENLVDLQKKKKDETSKETLNSL